MSDKGNNAKNRTLDFLLRDSGTVYIALYTATPSDSGGGTEVNAGGYTRKVVTFDVASNGATSNSIVVDWLPSGADYGTITHAAVHAHLTNDDIIYHKNIKTSRLVEDGVPFSFETGDIVITED